MPEKARDARRQRRRRQHRQQPLGMLGPRTAASAPSGRFRLTAQYARVRARAIPG